MVVNIEWHSDAMNNTDTLIDVGEIPVWIGDIYDGENFYREGVRVLTPMEQLQAQLAEYSRALTILGVTV